MNNSKSFSISSEKLTDFQTSLQEKIEQYGKPSLGIIYVHADLDIRGIHHYMDEQMIPMYTGLFMYLPENSFKIYHTKPGASELSGRELGLFTKNAFADAGIYMLIASKDTQTDIFIREVQQNSHDKVPLYGGYTFGNLESEEYTVFSNDYFEHNGIVAVVFNLDKVEMLGDSYSGWDSIGTTHTVTHSIGNELIEVDGKPALDVFITYFDYFDLEKVAKGEEDDEYIISNHPIKVIEADGASCLKSPMHINTDRKSMTFYCSVPEGTKFKFCNNPKMDITDNLIERIQKIQANKTDIDCFLITSCASRYLTLGPFFKKEVKRLFSIWEKPMVGFLSGGEIGNVAETNKSYFHNVTCVFTGFKIKTGNDG